MRKKHRLGCKRNFILLWHMSWPGEGSQCLVHYFKEEKDHAGPTGRIE
jgi:hypothetical protein